ncbi:MAG: hypothetical protein C0490_14030 [Marivirga sp.]|nr:hypothetical protein [Marivirga sp.]
MRIRSWFSTGLIFLASSCLERIYIDTDIDNSIFSTIAIEGHISNEPGPYTVKISNAFDLESKVSPRAGISAKRVVISDNQGVNEELSEVDKGIYRTKADGIHGTIGRAYKLQIEFADGRIYESVPDTLYPAGSIDSIYFTFTEIVSQQGEVSYGFDVFFNPVAAETSNHFLWKFTGTFQADTNPEFGVGEACGNPTCEGCNRCNYKPLCSGIRNISGFPDLPRAEFVRVGPCECCTCWYNFYNPGPLVSDDQFVQAGRFPPQKAMFVPLNAWYFQHKVHAKATQLSLSQQAFAFWKALKDQKSAINSLFQPVTGKIPGNMIQIGGPVVAVEGLFYASGVASKAIFIERSDVPNADIIPDPILWAESCLKLFPYATTTKPDFWN